MNGVHQIPGEPLRFRVDSDRAGISPYLVDLAENDGWGQCDCKHWQCRVAPLVRDGERASCKHVQRARSFLLDKLLKAIVEASKGGKR